MEESKVKIGEHIFYIKNKSSLLREFFNKNFIPVSDEKQSINMKIEIVTGFGVPFLNYKVKITKSHDRLSFQRADYLIEVDYDYTYAKIHVHNDLSLKHALMNLYSSFIVHHNWGILLHSACVLENGAAHIFSGQSGAGKSTAAKLSYPRELLSDEATIVKITTNEVTVFDSPFRSELASNKLDDSYSLKSIQLLHQSLQTNRTQLSKSTGLLHLIDKVFYWTDSAEETKRILRLLKTLVNQIDVYNLHFQKNNTFWERIS
ncbi:MAG: hypothetical protein ACQEWV_05235 [Bacillota bacterium]